MSGKKEFRFTLEELKILGAAVIVPPQSLSVKQLELIFANFSERFSEEGRKKYAIETCSKTIANGYDVPKDDGTFIEQEECIDMIIENDKKQYTEEAITNLIEKFKSIAQMEDYPNGYPD